MWFMHYIQNKTVKITNSFVSTVAMNNGHVGCYDCMVTYNIHVFKLIIIQLYIICSFSFLIQSNWIINNKVSEPSLCRY